MASSPNTYAATLKTALEELRQRRAEIEALKRAKNEPVAIVGMACRFPGDADTPERYWQLLDGGKCAIGEVPTNRWDVNSYYDPDPAAPGKMTVRRGGFVGGVDRFDAPFFGISPREAATMDPQQRLLLDVAWEALENANLPSGDLYEKPVGVFTGVTCFDHAMLLGGEAGQFGAYAGTGSALNAVAGRLSYLLGLTGPSMAVDTACSSSLVCLHLACQSLRAGECEAAIVGGVHLMLSAGVMVTFSQARMLSPDGLSKTFDASADGYSRGEGCGVVVLKRLSDALQDRDHVLGVVRGTAVGHSGPSGGLTVPSVSAQQAVIRQALAQAGVEPAEVSYVEAHGTGTSLGDPIEIEALAGVYGRGRAASDPLLTGSVKTNIGHLEPASGVAGLIKILLAFEHGCIPASLHFREPNPHLNWSELPIRVAAEPVPWPRGERKRIAGLSAFGFSGTNTHVVIEEPPATQPARNADGPSLLAISAKCETALRELAQRYLDLLGPESESDFRAICAAAALGRNHFRHRLAIVAASGAEARDKLRAFPAGQGEQGSELADRYLQGATIDWNAVFTGTDWKYVALPNYPFQRQTYPLIGAHESKTGPPPADWFYRVEWEESSATAQGGEARDWVIFADRGGVADGFARFLAARGERIERIARDEQAADLAGRHVAYFRSLDESSCADLLALAHGLENSRAKLWVVTRGATDGHCPEQAPLLGFAKTLFLEHPGLAGAVLDLDTNSPAGEAEAVWTEIVSESSEDIVAFRNGRRLVPRLVKAPIEPQAELRLDPEGVYLITGGFGALGLQTARWLVDRGAREIVLIGRHGPRSEEARKTIRDLESNDVVVHCERTDVTDRARMAELFRSYGSRLCGVIHAAGVPGYRAVNEIEPLELDAVLQPKVEGARVLHELSRDLSLDFFVCFSSIASVWGSRGQAHYGAANRYLDALAHYRRAEGLPALTINWGPWSGGGMNTPESDALLRRAGVYSLDARQALGAMEALIQSGTPQAVFAHIDWPRFRGSYEARGKRPLLARIEEGLTAGGPLPDGRGSVFASLPEVLRLVREETAHVLQLGKTPPETDRGFFEMGMDSLLALELRSRLEGSLGRSLPATLVFEYPTVAALADYLWRDVLGGAASLAPAAAEKTERSENEAIAIIGMACRFPGGATDPESYWRLLREGVDAITEVPRARWNLDEYYDSNPDAPGKMYCRHGGFLEGVDQFDPGFFRISPREAASMDPQHRLLLETSWEALEDAGIPADRLKGSQTGVFVGITTNDYAHLMPRNNVDNYFFTGNPLNTAAGRLAYTFGFQGPALALDTACSSSLVAIHQACQALRNGECETALAGGVNLILSPETTVAVCRTRALSPDGRCRTFDASANGFVRSEGCGVLVLKTCSKAVADGDAILAVIRGSAVNHDGASSGFTAPNGKAQEAVLRKALGVAVPPAAVDYVEAHGTGTQLGDPVEVRALAAVFRESPRKVRIGSVKSNIGHAESAAGVAGVIKLVLALEHEELPASLHVANPTPLLPWEELPVEICRERTPWRRGNRARIAGVSAFGASGTNAHLVLEEGPASNTPGEFPEYPLVLSARSEAALRELAAHYRTLLESSDDADFHAICDASATARAHLRYRLAIVAGSRVEAVHRLALFTAGEIGPGIYSGDVKDPSGDEIADGAPEAMAQAYVSGASFAPSRRPRGRVRLPHYPFQRVRTWFQESQKIMPSIENEASAGPRRDEILRKLKGWVAQSLHVAESDVEEGVPFLEMGADSLALVDVMQAIESEYKVRIGVRDLFDNLSTLNALAEHIDRSLPQESAIPLPGGRGSVAVSEPRPPGSGHPQTEMPSCLERVIAEQNHMVLQVVAQQMEMLRQFQAPQPAPDSPKKSEVKGSGRPTPLLPWSTPAPSRSALSTARQKHLDDLAARYIRRTRLSKEMVQASRPVLADSRATVGFRPSTKEMLYPIVGTRSQGSKLWDVDGNEYIDFTMGFGVHLFGHRPELLNRAIEEELHRGVELGARSDLVGEVAALFTQLTGHERVAFSNTGTEAVMAAMRLARAATGRSKIVAFTHSYHGHSDGTLAAARIQDGKNTTIAMAPGVPNGTVENMVVLEYGTAEALDTIRALTDELAAVMVEPVQSRNPSLQPTEFLREIRKITADCGAALIVDEMITGLRVHPRGAQGWFGIEADIATYGKIAGGGLPIGLVAGKARFLDGIDGGMWQYGDGSFPAAERTAFGGTFCQHPLSMAAARAVLRHLLEDGGQLQRKLNERTAELAADLNRFFEWGAVPIRVTHFGSMFRFEFSTNLDLFFYHLLEKGIYIWEWRTCFLSTAHTEADLAAFTRAIEETVAELRAGDWLPPAPAEPAPLRVPLSEAQRQLWLLHQIEPQGSLAYQINTSVELIGELDAARLRRVIQDVAVRHEALRTTIASEHEQIVWPASRIEVPLTDFSGLPAEEAERRFSRRQTEDSQRAIDLANGPIFRADLVRLAPTRHVLSLTAHHIVSDGSTMALLVGEIAEAYVSGRTPAPPPLQFREYLAAAASRLASDEMKAHRDYWLAQFGEQTAPLQLPSDRPRPARNTYRGGRVAWRLDAELTTGLRRFSRAQGCTLYASLFSAFAVFLHRITGQDDLIVGIPVTGRFSRESQGVAGYCTHLLPLRSRFAPDESFGRFLARNRQALLDALEHQEYPFAELLRELRERGAAPLVSVVFNLEPVSQFSTIDGLTLKPVDPEIQFAPFDLSVNVTDTGSELRIDCDYNSDLFERQTVLRFLAIYETLLRGALADSQAKISRMPLLSEAAQTELEAMWRGPGAPQEEISALELFERQTAHDPERIAVIDGTERLSYRELNARAASLAAELVKSGVGPETRVAICSERRAHLIAGLLAIWKAGGAYVPLDPEYPAERQKFMLEDSGASVVLADRASAGIIPETGARLVLLDHFDKTNPSVTQRTLRSTELAYVIYTSGSTGRPKGVAVTHGGVAWLVQWAKSFYSEAQLSGVLFSTSVCFDVSVFEIFVPLACGGTVILAENVLQLPQLPAADQVTLVSTVPSAIPELLRGGAWPASVDTIQLAGERLLRSTVQRIYRQTPVRQVLNLYGPTEDTVYATGTAIERDDEEGPTIGRPLLNKQAYVLDRFLQPVPVGVAGDFYLGGPGLAREYLNQPDLTRERFIADPFVPGERLYRTGDVARFREDGNIEFLGRSDHQIKLRGFRIELGEIEAALTAHPWVKDAIAVLRDGGESAQLAAYVTSARPEAETTAALRDYLQTRLPGHMVPSQFVVLNEFPVLPNGKVDRARLPEPGVGTLYSAPRDAAEERLKAIWQEAIGRQKIGVLDNFFEIGGNSLSATRVAARIRETMRSDVQVRTIFAYPTIAGLAREIARRETSSYDPIVPVPAADTYAVSPAQKRFWIEEQTRSTEGSALPACFLVEGTLHDDLFEDAFRRLIARHEILRTVFPVVRDLPRQKVLSPSEIKFTAERHEARTEAEAVALVRRSAAVPMDLANGPLFRVQLVRLEATKHLCACTMHHIITDGWSIEVLLDEFLRTYDALAEGAPVNLPALSIQYKDYAEWLNQLLASERGLVMREYWVRQLGGDLAPLDFPTAIPRERAGAHQRKTHRFHLSEERVRQIETLGQRHGASEFMVLLAGLNALLYRNTGNEDLIIGSPVAGRVRTELEGQIGPYLNIVALRTCLTGSDRFDALLDRVREITLDAYANQLYPFDRVIEQLGIKRVAGRNPLFDIGFTFQNQRERAAEPSRALRIEERTYPEMNAAAEALTDFWFVAEPAGGGLDVNLVYNGALFGEATVNRLAGDFQAILASVIADSGIRLHSIPLEKAAPRRSRARVTIDLALEPAQQGTSK